MTNEELVNKFASDEELLAKIPAVGVAEIIKAKSNPDECAALIRRYYTWVDGTLETTTTDETKTVKAQSVKAHKAPAKAKPEPKPTKEKQIETPEDNGETAPDGEVSTLEEPTK